MLLNVSLGFLTFIVIYFFGDKLMMAFTHDANVIAIGREYLVIMAGFFMIHGGLNVFNGALRGAGDTLFPMITSIICLWLIRIPIAYYFGKHFGRVGIWWGIGLSISIGFVITYVYYKMGYWKRRSVNTQM